MASEEEAPCSAEEKPILRLETLTSWSKGVGWVMISDHSSGLEDFFTRVIVVVKGCFAFCLISQYHNVLV